MNKSNSLEHLFPMHLLMKRNSGFNTVIDVGVNTLRYIEFYSQYFDNVIGIEANPITYDKMKHSIPTNSSLHNVCLTNTFGVSDFYSCIPDSGYSTSIYDRYVELINDGTFYETDFEVFQMTKDSIDNMFANQQGVDLIKIDAEYEDINIFLGAIDLIRNSRPVIQIEHVTHQRNTDIFYDTISNINYVEIKPHFESRNYFFIPKEDTI